MKSLLLALTLTGPGTLCPTLQTQKQVILRGGTAVNMPIPVGVASLTVEAWGAGGGGSILGGGQGGGYFKCTIPVQGNDNLVISVGSGGKGGTVGGKNGGDTTLSLDRPQPTPPYSRGLYRFAAQGGAGSSTTASTGGSYTDDQIQYGFNLPMQYSFSGLAGGNGSPTTVPMMSVRPDNSVIGTSVGGNGGDGANALNTKGIGGSETQLMKVNTPLAYYVITSPALWAFAKVIPSAGLAPGGGGGGATAFNQTNTGADGGDGLMVITYSN